MEQFEYKIINISKSHLKKDDFQTELMERLNELGAQGWELITIEGVTEGSIFWQVGETVDILFIFKRKKIEIGL